MAGVSPVDPEAKRRKVGGASAEHQWLRSALSDDSI